jgi:phosphatidylinositol phospholipase C delta
MVIGKEADTRYTIDPYVEVSVHVPDWSASLPLPVREGAVSPPRGNDGDGGPSTARTTSHVTSAVKNNGWNPMWQELISIPFECAGDMMDLIFIKFQVKDEHNGEEIAGFCAPLGSLRRGARILCVNLESADTALGFRHLPLHDKQFSQFFFSTLFVQINIREVQD